MSVIVNEMPNNCLECPLSYWDYYFSDLPLRCPLMSDKMEVNPNKRYEDCPLKSIGGLIEELKHCADRKLDFVLGCNDLNERQKHMEAVNTYQRCISIIKEYCRMEDAE